ncbi:MAG: cell division protein FtsZ, partial [Microthrixaceae bacterium]|nr:cell division protein FtsZ [Microthrixaceae bacterium]
HSALLDVSIDGARSILFNIKGGDDLSLFEVNEAAEIVRANTHPEANIIFGTVIDDTLGDEVRVTVIAAGFDGGEPTARLDVPAVAQATPAPAAQAQTIVVEETGEVPAVALEREPAPVGAAAGSSYAAPISDATGFDAGFDDGALDVPDFLK